MTDLETRLRDALHDAARTVEPSDTTLTDIEPRRERRGRAWVVAPVAIAAIVALVVATIALWPSHDDRLHVTGGPAGPVAFVPTRLPNGWTVARVGGAGEPSGGFVCIDGSYASGRLTCKVVSGTVTWSAAPPDHLAVSVETTMGDDRAVLALVGRLGPLVPTSVRGHPGAMVRSSSAAALTWEERPGLRVSVIVPGGTNADPARIAENLRSEPVPLDRVPVVASTVEGISVVTRPTDPGMCMGLVVQGGVMPCSYSQGDTARTFPYRGLTVLYGAFASGDVVRVRVTLSFGTAATQAHVVPGLRGAFFALVLPSSVPPGGVEALDGSGRVVERIPASAIDVGAGSPFVSRSLLDPSAPVVATTSTGARLRASWTGASVCVGVDENGSTIESACGVASDVGSMVQATRSDFVFGAVSDDVTTIRAQPVTGPPVRVDVVHDARFPFGFYIAPVPASSAGYDLTMLDAQGHIVGSGGMRP